MTTADPELPPYDLFAIPCFGNFFPSRVSFLMSMRYYAGNWACNIWLEAFTRSRSETTG